MKKIFAITVLCLLAASLSAQSVRLYHNGQPLNDGDTVMLATTVGQTSTAYVGYAANFSEDNVFLRVRRENVEMVPGDGLLFCVGGTCVQTVSGEFALFAGDTITEENTNMVFHADYTANSQGTSIVRFTFFNTEDEEDAVSFYLKASTSLGVQSPSVPVQLTAYPNPATSVVNIRYHVAGGNAANLVVRNIVGSEIYRQEINGEGKLSVPTNDMAPGVYFYGVEENGRMLVTKKLLVK